MSHPRQSSLPIFLPFVFLLSGYLVFPYDEKRGCLSLHNQVTTNDLLMNRRKTKFLTLVVVYLIVH
jgi:hypothetical protein